MNNSDGFDSSSLREQVSRLLRLKSSNAKPAVALADEAVATAWLAELFKGNGWTVAFHTGAWNRRSLLLSDPKQPDTIVLIVKFILNKEELPYEKVKQELIDFENNIGPEYGGTQFSLIALNGFESRVEKLQDFNLLLEDWSYIEELIDHYSKDKVQEPRIQLFAHNKQTYKKVLKMMTHANGIAVVQATGTGKSYLIAKLLQDFTGEKRLVMAPSYYVIDQIKEHIRWEADLPGEANKIEFMTYARSMNLSPAEISELKPKMIVMDEFHRCGAEEWGRGVQNILNTYPKAFKFGTSATPIRYLDNGRDMSIELFQGHVAENLSLAQAIVRNILPMPKYVCALYTLSEEIHSLKAKIAGSRKREEAKKQLLLELDAFHIDWERSRGIPHVLKKHLRKNMRKFLIFCKDEEHLNEMEPMVKKWFKEAMDNISIKSYIVHSKEAQSDEQLEAFKNDLSKDHLHLLFSIDMLNEGLHVNEVNGVVLLRPTESPNIFYQQIGRCLKVGLNERPVIFDFVNNFRTIRTHDFLRDLDTARKDLFDKRNEEGLEGRCPSFDVNDEVREITEVFGQIKFRLENWNEMYDKLVEFHKRFGHVNVPSDWQGNNSLCGWLGMQRKRHYFKKLEDDQQRKLDELGVEWTYEPVGPLKERWDQFYNALCDYKKKNGDCNVPYNVGEYRALATWAHNQRTNHRKGKLEKSNVDKLKKIGFVFELLDGAWEKKFQQLDEFRKKFGHCNVPHNNSEHRLLNRWCQHQRQNSRTGILEKEKIKRLKDIGFDFEPVDLEGDWQERFDELVAYKKQNGHLEVSPPENKTLNIWIGRQRRRYRKELLAEDRIKKLESIGFVWELGNNKYFEKKFVAMQKFKHEHGHLKFSLKHPLTAWQTHLRNQHKEGKLTEQQQHRLKELGFDYVFRINHTLVRERRLKELESFYKKYGHINVTLEHKDFASLAEWLNEIRKPGRRASYPKELIDHLNAMGMVWERNVLDRKWNKMYDELLAHYKRTGSTFISRTDKIGPVLRGWCTQQRTYRREGRVPKERIEKLDKIGFIWEDTKDTAWEMNFQQLLAFKKRYGHCSVTGIYKEKHKKLFHWVHNIKAHYKRGSLTALQIQKLTSIGFDVTSRDAEITLKDKRFEELEEFYKKHGHIDITAEHKDMRHLLEWFKYLRERKKSGAIAHDIEARLDSMGMDWSGNNYFKNKWYKMYQKLVDFSKSAGSAQWAETISPELKNWCFNQRKDRKYGKVPKDRIEMLDKIGFTWAGTLHLNK